jgi:hypothetical protein
LWFENQRAWELYNLCSSRARVPVFEGVGPIDSIRAKDLIEDYEGGFEDYEKILLVDNIFLKKAQEKAEREKEQSVTKQPSPPETRIPKRR